MACQVLEAPSSRHRARATWMGPTSSSRLWSPRAASCHRIRASTTERIRRAFLGESGTIVEVVTGQVPAYGLGILLEEHLQAAAQGGAHLGAGDADDVALGDGLFGDGRLDNLKFSAELTGLLYVFIDPGGAESEVGQELLHRFRMFLREFGANQDAGGGAQAACPHLFP